MRLKDALSFRYNLTCVMVENKCIINCVNILHTNANILILYLKGDAR